jgi:hypothetical protein
MERIEKERKKKEDKRLQEEEKLLTRFREELEADRPLRAVEISEEDVKAHIRVSFLTKNRCYRPQRGGLIRYGRQHGGS